MATFGTRLKHAWNAFTNQEQQRKREPFTEAYLGGASYGMRPDRSRLLITNERSIISSIYTRLGIDVAKVSIRHVRTDDQRRYISDIDSGLNECLTIAANIDQPARMFRQDAAMTLFDKGVIAIVPVDTTISPLETGGYDIKTLRVGEVVMFYGSHVRVCLFNESTARREEITLHKNMVAIVENPFYSIMNEPNSTLQRLIRKLNLLDTVDDASASGKLDLIIQLPYVVKSEARRKQAEQRRTDIEFQLKGSKYGIAYTDGTEKITQLNRPAENNLLSQIELLTKQLYTQLGLTEEIMNGTADENTMVNYNNRTIEPIVAAMVEAMRRTFITKTARTQFQDIMYFRDPFQLMPLSEFADIADVMARNEIMSSNEIRQAIGKEPSKDPKADLLQNSNMPQPNGQVVDSTAEDLGPIVNDLGLLEGG